MAEKANGRTRARAARPSRTAEATPADVGQPPTFRTAADDADDFPYGAHTCPNCGEQVSRLHPGFADPDAHDRETVCPSCGERFVASRKTLAKARD